MSVRDRAAAERERQAAAAAGRYDETSAERHAAEQQQAGVAFPDSREAIAARASRLLDRHAVSASLVVDVVHEEPLAMPAAYERILGASKELQAWSFLPRGARAASTVGRISAHENGRELPFGTGFLVSPSLLLTNHHVLTDVESARRCFVEFGAQVTVDNAPQPPTRLALDPDAFFAADERLDYALVLVDSGPGRRPPGEMFGWNRLSVQLGKLVVGEPVNIIGHPMGRLKEIAVRDNTLQVRLDEFLHYRTDTEPGNSGSPVFNDQWEVVALHHSGVPRTDDQGRVLRRDGQVWQQGDGDDAIDWVSNEGVRISSVLKHLGTQPLGPRQRALLAELGPESGLDNRDSAGVTPTTRTAPGPGPVGAPAPAGPVAARPAPAPVVTAPPAAGEEAVARAGLRGREGAFGGERHLVFLHGRGQQGKDPVRLRREWAAGLNHGLIRAGLPPVSPADAWFPFYGDRLARALTMHESVRAVPRPPESIALPAAETDVPASPAGHAVYEEILGEAAAKAGASGRGAAGDRAARPE